MGLLRAEMRMSRGITHYPEGYSLKTIRNTLAKIFNLSKNPKAQGGSSDYSGSLISIEQQTYNVISVVMTIKGNDIVEFSARIKTARISISSDPEYYPETDLDRISNYVATQLSSQLRAQEINVGAYAIPIKEAHTDGFARGIDEVCVSGLIEINFK